MHARPPESLEEVLAKVVDFAAELGR